MSNERPYKRTDRVASEILSILGQIQTQYIDLSNLGFITFTHVSISKDLKIAKIFYSVVNHKKTMEKIDSELNLKAKAFRKYLGQNLRIKFTPELKFYYDDTNSYIQKIEKIFHDFCKLFKLPLIVFSSPRVDNTIRFFWVIIFRY